MAQPSIRRMSTRAEGGGRERWDVGRFLRTVLFFNPLPPPLSLLRGELADRQPASPEPGDWVLVTGATGGVGRRVVARLLASGASVRALVRDEGKAARLLGPPGRRDAGRLETVVADITRPETLAPHVRGLRAIISATAATVAPKEGDTPDRQKYMQGIRFYEPEVVGQTPEAVEARGVANLLQAVQQADGFAGDGGLVIFDARGECPAVEWGPLDDVVMGGVSQSAFRTQPGGQAAFVGRVSAANNGGFASVRTRNFSPPLNTAGCDALRLTVFGDGQRYKLTVRTDAKWDGIGYTQSFDTKPGEWQDIDLPFSAFRAIFRAKQVAAAPFDPASLVSVQLMLSKFEYDGQLNPAFRPGDFELPVSRIAAVRAAAGTQGPPRIVHVSSAGVTRPGRPGLDLDKEPPAVRMNEQLGGLLTWKLAGEDAVRASGLPFAVVRPVALTEEPAGAPLEVGQGDELKGKVSREDIAELCVALLSLPVARNTTFEVKSTLPFSQPYEPAGLQPPRDWAALLAGLRQGVTGKQSESTATGSR